MKKRIFLILMLLLIVIISIVIFFVFNNKNDYVGNWVADGTQFQTIISVDKNGKPIYADENSAPYYLSLKKNNKCTLKLTNQTLDGTYQINDNKEISLKLKNQPITLCKIISKKELECNLFASKFIKE